MEAGLHRVVRAWKCILERCLDTLEATDHKDSLKWWGSPRLESASQRPFELPQSSKTLTKYSTIWEQLLCYLLRTAPVAFEDETETGIKFTRGQWECTQQIQELLQAPPQGDSDEEDTDLISKVMDLCQLVLMQDSSKIPLYDSPLMHYLAVQGFDPISKAF